MAMALSIVQQYISAPWPEEVHGMVAPPRSERDEEALVVGGVLTIFSVNERYILFITQRGAEIKRKEICFSTKRTILLALTTVLVGPATRETSPGSGIAPIRSS